MSSIVLATSEIFDAATVTGASTASADTSVDRSQTMQPGDVVKFENPSTAYFEVDLGEAKTISFIGAISHNMTNTGSIRVRADSQQANLTASTVAYDSGPLPARSHQDSFTFVWTEDSDDPDNGAMDSNNFVLQLSTEKRFRWWRLDLDDDQSTDGFTTVGRVVIDKAWNPEIGVQPEWGIGWQDTTLQEVATGGQFIPTEKTRSRTLEFELAFLTEDDMYDNGFELDRKRGKSKDVLVVRNVSATTHMTRQTVYGLMAELSPIAQPDYGVFRKRFRINELIP